MYQTNHQLTPPQVVSQDKQGDNEYWNEEEYEEQEEEEVRDLTDEEFNSLNLEERKKIAAKQLKLKREYFHPNMMLMHSNIMQSEFRELHSRNEEAA